MEYYKTLLSIWFLCAWLCMYIFDSSGSPWGIYPDMLHILDLTIFCDLFASAYLVWTDDRSIFDAPSRDGRLQKIHGIYTVWCTSNSSLALSEFLIFFWVGFSFLWEHIECQEKNKLRNSKQFSGESVAILVENIAAKAICISQHWAEEVEWRQLTDDDLLCNGTCKSHQQRSPIWCEWVLGAKV